MGGRLVYQLLIRVRGAVAWPGLLVLLAVVNVAYYLRFPLASQQIGLSQAAVTAASSVLVVLRLFVDVAARAVRRRQLSRQDVTCILGDASRTSSLEFAADLELTSRGNCRFTAAVPPRPGYRCPVDLDDLRVLSEINCRAFAQTPYAGGYHRKFARNRGMWHRVPQSFLTINCPSGSSARTGRPLTLPIYFSCIFPLSHAGFRCYFTERRARDVSFDPAWLATSPADADAILIFSMAKDPLLTKVPGIGGTVIATEFVRASLHHLQLIQRRFFPARTAQVYIQNDDPTFRALLPRLGFVTTGLRTADDEMVYSATLHP